MSLSIERTRRVVGQHNNAGEIPTCAATGKEENVIRGFVMPEPCLSELPCMIVQKLAKNLLLFTFIIFSESVISVIFTVFMYCIQRCCYIHYY